MIWPFSLLERRRRLRAFDHAFAANAPNLPKLIDEMYEWVAVQDGPQSPLAAWFLNAHVSLAVREGRYVAAADAWDRLQEKISNGLKGLHWGLDATLTASTALSRAGRTSDALTLLQAAAETFAIGPADPSYEQLQFAIARAHRLGDRPRERRRVLDAVAKERGFAFEAFPVSRGNAELKWKRLSAAADLGEYERVLSVAQSWLQVPGFPENPKRMVGLVRRLVLDYHAGLAAQIAQSIGRSAFVSRDDELFYVSALQSVSAVSEKPDDDDRRLLAYSERSAFAAGLFALRCFYQDDLPGGEAMIARHYARMPRFALHAWFSCLLKTRGSDAVREAIIDSVAQRTFSRELEIQKELLTCADFAGVIGATDLVESTLEEVRRRWPMEMLEPGERRRRQCLEASSLIDSASWADARPLAELALAGESSYPAQTEALHVLARACTVDGDMEAALAHYRELCVRARVSYEESRLRWVALVGIAHASYYLGLGFGEELEELKTIERASPKAKSLATRVRSLESRAASTANQWERSLSLAREALEGAKTVHGTNSPILLEFARNEDLALRRLGRTADADALINEYAELAAGSVGLSHPWAAWIYQYGAPGVYRTPPKR
ncbi:MAG: hypothetical protein AAF938_13740 [Myxococcota bacterium]